MKSKHFVISLMMAMMPFSIVQVNALPVSLDFSYIDPDDDQENPQRSPILVPEVDLDGHTLTFYTSCLGSTLRLVNAEDEVIYTTVITSGTLVLPSSLEGEYELQIIQGEWCFYGWIEL